MQDIINGRCGWCGTDSLYVKYHDEEWGKPGSDDNVLFEFLVLESAQAGLNWLTILKKREGYRRAFCNFSIELTAQMSDEDIEKLMTFDGIIKNRLKIKSAVTNARLFLGIQKEFGIFHNYFCGFQKADCQPFPLLKRGSRLIAGIRRHQQRYEKTGF